MIESPLQSSLNAATALCVNADLSTVSAAEFWREVAAERELLASSRSAEVALWQTDSYDFLVLLFAALTAGKKVLLPPSRLAAQEREFNASGIYFIQRQTTACANTELTAIEQWLQQDGITRSELAFYTSGSTGEPKRIPRTLQQLFAEVDTIAATFSPAQGSVALASVSHQHIYGLLFKLLLPLLKGLRFYRDQLHFPEDLSAQAQRLASAGEVYIVASPALLKRWPPALPLTCQWLASSGGMLPAGVRAGIDAALVEIYGSSETGGIASRWADHDLWQPLPTVHIALDANQQLLIQSPHAFCQSLLATGDRAELAADSQRFNLLGRQDRIVKLEEKRISLDEVERALLQLPTVEQAYVTVLEHGARQFLAAVVALDAASMQALQSGQLTKQQWLASNKPLLAEQLESVALPRHWRLLSALPYNAQSKLEKNYLNSLFDDMLTPVIISQQLTAATAQFELNFPAELTCFKGHFPAQPIFPGVAQIAFVQTLAKRAWADLGWVCAMEQMKFQDLIRPYSQLTLQLVRREDSVSFQLQCNEKCVASGRLRWQCEQATHA